VESCSHDIERGRFASSARRGQRRFINSAHCNSRRNASKLHMRSVYKWNATVRITRSTHSTNHHSIHRRSTCGSYAWNACTKAECTSLKFVKGAACDLYSKVHRFRAFTGIYFYASAIKGGDKKQMNRVCEAERFSALFCSMEEILYVAIMSACDLYTLSVARLPSHQLCMI